jgi:nucleoside-diphosphate-sugar epimerase
MLFPVAVSKDQVFLVTGASGYIGGAMVAHLSAQGLPVRGMIRTPAKAAAVKALGASDVVVGDLTDADSIRRAVEGCRSIYHFAAIFRQVNVADSEYHDVNAEGTRRLLEAAIQSGVERVIYCSTGGVLGHIAHPPGTEETPYSPGDAYQSSKVEGERIALEYFRSGRVGGCVIRPAMVYGPADTRHLKMFRMIANGTFFYVGPSLNVHFVDVRDVARAFQLAMEHTERNGEVYIVAGERSVSLTEMVTLIASLLNVPAPRVRLPVKPMQWVGSLCEWACKPFRIQPPIYRRRVDFFVNNREFSTAKAQRELGYRPARPFEAEVAEVVTWYCRHGWLKSGARTVVCVLSAMLPWLAIEFR